MTRANLETILSRNPSFAAQIKRARERDAIAELQANGTIKQSLIVAFDIHVATVSEANVRQHWAARARRVKAQRAAAFACAQAAGVGPDLMPCSVTLTRVSPRQLDDDNLRGATKACRDGIADALGIDDRDARVSWHYAQERAGKARIVRVNIETQERTA